MNPVSKLQSLYMEASKHSGYQMLSHRLSKYLSPEMIRVRSRHESERLQFIEQWLELKGKRILDIGANAGFFTFEAVDRGAKELVVYEGNSTLAEFIGLASRVLEIDEQITIHNRYLEPAQFHPETSFDVTFLMNVLHHIGDDFGDPTLGIDAARRLIADGIREMATKTRYMVFQLGYCWKGNRDALLFANGAKQEQIDFVTAAAAGCWNLLAIAIPQMTSEGLRYLPPSPENLARNDVLGEFLNRPLFVMESLRGN